MTRKEDDEPVPLSEGDVFIPPEFVRYEEYDRLSQAFVIFRRAIRATLSRAGVPNNPGFSDQEVCDALAGQLGVPSDYESAVRSVTGLAGDD